MTMEQFERATELYEEKEFVAAVEGLLQEWTTNDDGIVKNKLAIMYNEKQSWSGKDHYVLEGYSSELRKRLVKTCKDYYNELMKAFGEV